MKRFLTLAWAVLVVAQVKPQFKDARIVGNVTNPNMNRDSCGSVKMGNRAFWTCRDSQYRLYDQTWSFVFSHSVGWTDYNEDGSPKLQTNQPIGPGSTGENEILLMAGPNPQIPLFFPVGPDMCPETGVCTNGSRWVHWPDSPPVVTSVDLNDGTITAYSFVLKTRLNGIIGDNKPPPTSLFKLTYKPTDDPNVLPQVEVIDYEFWAHNEVDFGVYGNVVRNNYLYLYGKAIDDVGVMLARVPVFLVEQKFFYEYYVDGKWTRDKPAIDNNAAEIPNASLGGQGTYYWSDRYNCYFWIGQVYFDTSADFYITSAPNPEGPWVEPYLLWQGAPNGNQELHSYTLQAHPHMVNPDKEDGIYVSWTQNDDVYITPLAFISFEYII